jgi:hypothetical protein
VVFIGVASDAQVVRSLHVLVARSEHNIRNAQLIRPAICVIGQLDAAAAAVLGRSGSRRLPANRIVAKVILAVT